MEKLYLAWLRLSPSHPAIRLVVSMLSGWLLDNHIGGEYVAWSSFICSYIAYIPKKIDADECDGNFRA